MFGKKALPFGTIVVVLTIALATAGLGYAWWNTSLADQGVVNTGSFRAIWAGTFTDDGGHVDADSFDSGDVPVSEQVLSARDPIEPGPNPDRTDRAVGHCASWINANDPYTLYWRLDNVYPGYYCTVWSNFANEGTVPMEIQAASLNRDAGISTGYVEGYAPTIGTVVDPGQSVRVGMWVRVDQSAEPGNSYTGTSSITLIQWNATN